MKKLCFLVAAILTVSGGYAQTQPNPKKPRQIANQAPAAKLAPLAVPKPTGPSGFGPLKLGMTREAVEGRQASDGVYLVWPLSPDTSNFAVPANTELVKSQVLTPLDNNPEKISLTFTSGLLTGFVVTLNDTSFGKVKSQLIEKYGTGKIDDDRKDEQCIYRNGSNFKVNSGSVATRWTQSVLPTEEIKSALVEYTVNWCPPSLNGPTVGPSTTLYLSVQQVHVDQTPKANLF